MCVCVCINWIIYWCTEIFFCSRSVLFSCRRTAMPFYGYPRSAEHTVGTKKKKTCFAVDYYIRYEWETIRVEEKYNKHSSWSITRDPRTTTIYRRPSGRMVLIKKNKSRWCVVISLRGRHAAQYPSSAVRTHYQCTFGFSFSPIRLSVYPFPPCPLYCHGKCTASRFDIVVFIGRNYCRRCGRAEEGKLSFSQHRGTIISKRVFFTI